jgi:hypothetical protein
MKMTILFFLVAAQCVCVCVCVWTVPEDGDSMFLRNLGVCLRVYTASQLGITTSSNFK